ncbi:tetratricopeptide repeat protein, partial [Nitratireductor sp. GCM10026969]|uniref:tetratricopeptide repeat protein n=1 Tax=Nitratireductor sp. GCM10026969 TaxID=3252645 RepID=UPI003609E739
MFSRDSIRTTPRRSSRIAISAVLALATVAAAGCASSGRKVDGVTTGSVERSGTLARMSSDELAGAAVSLGEAYSRDPKDKSVALRYASILQMSGRTDQSLAVMRKLAIEHPQDREVLAAYGKALAAAGELEPAL